MQLARGGRRPAQRRQPLGIAASPRTRASATCGKSRRITGVQFEWLATGRGAMALCDDVRAGTRCRRPTRCWWTTRIELRLLRAFRAVSAQSRVSLVELSEQLAAGRLRRERATAQAATGRHGRRGTMRSFTGLSSLGPLGRRARPRLLLHLSRPGDSRAHRRRAGRRAPGRLRQRRSGRALGVPVAGRGRTCRRSAAGDQDGRRSPGRADRPGHEPASG